MFLLQMLRHNDLPSFPSGLHGVKHVAMEVIHIT